MVPTITRLTLLFLLCLPVLACAQEGEPVRIFYDTRVVHGHSTEVSDEGSMKFIISHRFGRINSGAYNLYGLDNSTIRLGFDYGFTKRLTAGVGRSSFEKTYDGYLKYNLMRQVKGNSKRPVAITLLSGMALTGLRWEDENRENYFTSRLYFNHHILIAKRFTDRLAVQVTPSLVHRNLVSTVEAKNDVLALGSVVKYLISKRVTLNLEYYYTLPDQLLSQYKNSLALGIDLETKGHVFQFHFGNSRGMIEKFFIAETTGNVLDGEIHFGFNITRDFKLKGRK